jgi:xanthine dehydrogenase YagR molybdenum-binding subunit
MEPHATLAVWNGNHLTVYDSTQGIFGVRKKLSKAFSIPPEQVRVITKFVGGGFGCKGSAWSHVVIAALAAKQLGRPVKVALTRPQMFGMVGGRPLTRQKISAAATKDGTLTALRHESLSTTSRFDDFLEPAALVSRHQYKCDNIQTSHRLVRLDIATPTYMRAPGESSGSFALESAVDELAHELGIDPVEFRLRNYAEVDPTDGRPFSSKSLRRCYELGAERFGWRKRSRRPELTLRGGKLVGIGMATASYPANFTKASALVRMNPDGTVLVQSGAVDLGTGTYTVMAQVAAEALGVPYERVRFDLGDTAMPESPRSGGSTTAASVASAVEAACRNLRQKLDGTRAPLAAPVEAVGQVAPSEDRKKYSLHSFGAQFAEVEVDPDLGMVRVVRLVGAFAAGRILNARLARSQFMGGMVWGIGMALHEDAVYDEKLGRIMTRDLADYHVPSHKDVMVIDPVFLPVEKDEIVDPAGVKGIGEIGITGAAAAIANAVFDATGKRVRSLPITPDKLL